MRSLENIRITNCEISSSDSQTGIVTVEHHTKYSGGVFPCQDCQGVHLNNNNNAV